MDLSPWESAAVLDIDQIYLRVQDEHSKKVRRAEDDPTPLAKGTPDPTPTAPNPASHFAR